MKDRIENKLSMALAVLKVLNDNTSLWNNIPAMVTAHASLTTIVAQIQGAQGISDQDIRGVPIDKNVKKSEAIEIAISIIGALKAYAKTNANNTLLKKIDYSRTELGRDRDTDTTQKLIIVRDEATANLAALASYNITAALVNSLTSAITAYEISIPKPRVASNIRKNAVETLDRLNKELDNPLQIIDGLMETIRQTQSAFYKTYKNARIIVDSAGAGTGVKGTVTDKLTGSPLQSVLISINIPVNLEKSKPVPVPKARTTSTNQAGNYEMKKIKPGIYTLTFTKKGYNSLNLPVNINDGSLTDADVALERQ